MSLLDRHEDILRILELRERMSVGELTERLGVSEVTIRKDLSTLEELGHLVRTRGGARLAQDRSGLRTIERRLADGTEQKQLIARAAATLVREGETLFLDSGSTCLEVVRAIREKDIRIVTNSLDILCELATGGRIAAHMIGGSFRQDARSFIGPVAEESVRRFHYDRAFIGASGITEDGVFSCQNAIESEVKRAAIAQSERIVVVSDSSKLGHSAFSIFARPSDIHMLITDATPATRALAARAPFEVLLVGEEET